jgi:regulation of enolase protein 1 (concanavalin A-like superfamily)
MANTLPILAGIPQPLAWGLAPVAWSQNNDLLSISAGPQTDLFIDPQGATPMLNAPRLLFEAPGDWMLSAQVRVEFGATFDAGVLLIWGGEHTWAKLCFEYSPQREPMVVSVVTNGTSDDANAFTVAGDTVRLRVARIGSAFAFHAAVAGGQWQLIRHFALANPGPITAGFVAQSPTGAGCTAHFSEVAFLPERLADLRSGV